MKVNRSKPQVPALLKRPLDFPLPNVEWVPLPDGMWTSRPWTKETWIKAESDRYKLVRPV
jgi:hypothetical protein